MGTTRKRTTENTNHTQEKPEDGAGVTPGVSVVVTAVPPRVENGMLARAVASVQAQTRQPEELIVEIDVRGESEPIIRNRALERVTTRWVAWLDDDDWLLPQHLETLLANSDGADLIYPWFSVHEGEDPWPDAEGVAFDAERMVRQNYVPVTYLVRTDLARRAKFPLEGPGWPFGTDWVHHQRLLELGARYRHVPERTWVWVHGSHPHARERPWTEWETANG